MTRLACRMYYYCTTVASGDFEGRQGKTGSLSSKAWQRHLDDWYWSASHFWLDANTG